MAISRTPAPGLVLLAAATVLVAACGHGGNQTGASSKATTPASSAAASTAGPAAAPGQRVCADPKDVPAKIPKLRDKLAQLLMVGVRDAADARAVVTESHVGGILIGSDTDLSMLPDGLRDIANAATPLPLAVGVDEEGGRVSRLRTLLGGRGPTAREMGNTMTAQQVHDLALDRGRKMKDLGITVDFAPVVDVTDAPDETVIGDRSFGADPAKVTELAGAYAQGLRDAGLLPVLKHFPGHGHGSGDSHKGGVTTPPLSDLIATDLVPYQTLLTKSPVAVMIGHMQVPGLTAGEPASLSAPAVTLLRTGTGYGGPAYDGAIFSDDLSSMAAISDRFGVTEAVLKTLQAGLDIALWVTTKEVPAVLDRLEQAVNANELPAATVDAALVRVAAMKRITPTCGG
ncbi:glycoside hydrolase family 3 N-terminal domain-containing protein [Mycobacterium vicinigordonae]|uniref:beta-N-acetylhexosaminidase n=1 Tax=Mycobacterium vicinigordonae TaxID=1719132 RepID=A0A7D6DYM1_9MYCO|nr:glycoside hydrolase family 3 N-terminal domain-containing protein [Mycobacterium vicinigordonae]QLL07947.1 glycoside hydrolase family 3 protein [Mycobacterium vicinigordonae]